MRSTTTTIITTTITTTITTLDLLFGSAAHDDVAQESVVDVHHSLPGDGARVHVQASEPHSLLVTQVLGVATLGVSVCVSVCVRQRVSECVCV